MSLQVHSQVHTPRKGTCRQTRLATPAHNSRTAKRLRLPRCPLADGQINKMCCVDVLECHSAIKRNEVLTQATTRMNTTLNERTQKQKAIWGTQFCLQEMSRTGKPRHTRLVAARAEVREYGREGWLHADKAQLEAINVMKLKGVQNLVNTLKNTTLCNRKGWI